MAIEYLIPGRLARGNVQFLQSDGSVRLQKGVFGSSVQKKKRKKAIVFAFLHQRWLHVGAADEARTRYLHLGKVALYQMSYGRILITLFCVIGVPAKICEAKVCGEKEKIWYSSQKSCLQDFPMNDRIFDVVPPIGIEPMTRGFSVPCSTD